ncbi:ATP-binding protein [Limosilactobacillus pontis]|uniref:ATP-binding protein n=1 Tax=Limosilactobacillus pontis TaxID=35787 RepID=A0ABT7UX81_9LACO|nr:ATP-binding protein [Limosilactobacillus pontis]MDM8266301.1 ATP-binding protein [Limosilactobacillus pontis]
MVNDPSLKKIHIVFNGQETPPMKISQLFDARRFNRLTAVTGNVTADFFNRYLSNFIKVELALQTPKASDAKTADEVITKEALANALLAVANKRPAKLFEGLTSSNQANVLSGLFTVEISPVQALHSRFYLLSNHETHDTRVILGSIDLTADSFDKNRNQFEEVLVFDNDIRLFQNLSERFKKDIRPVLRPYFTDNLLKAAQAQLNEGAKDQKQVVPENQVVILDNDTTDQIAAADMTDIISHDVQKQMDAKIIPTTTTNAMREVTTARSQTKDDIARDVKQHDTVYNLQKTSVSPRAVKPKIKTREKIYQQVQEALISGMTPQQRQAEKKYTTFLYDRPMERNLVRNNSGLYVPNDAGTHPIPFGKLATTSQIRDGLRSIDAVMKGYQKFVVDYTDDYGKRFYEAILYTFTAPFLWEIRQKASLNPEDGNDVPNFLVLGATAGSGKSTLLRIINQLTWNTDRSLIDFGTIYPTETVQRKAKTVEAIEHYMKQGSSYPVLLDEIEPYFFQQDQYSRHLVVDTMNELVNNPHAIAPLIGTTNYDSGFTMLRETARRTYYLQIDKVINDQLKGEANKYIYNVRQTLDNTLFKDFVMRMANLLEDDETPWRDFNTENGRLDFLSNTRKIFRDYYQMAGMDVPSYFADQICDDFQESSRNSWAKLYVTQAEDFKYREADKSLLFDISKLNTFNGFTADSIEKYRNALPIELCVDGINGKRGKFVEIKAPEFFKWIGERNPYETPQPVHTEQPATKIENSKLPSSAITTEKPKKRGFWARLFG